MVDITPIIPEGRMVIDGYGGGSIIISGKRYKGCVYVAATTLHPLPDATYAALSEKDFSAIADHLSEVELLLVGSGTTFSDLPSPLLKFFKQKGIAVELMDTGAACRTYNILLAEGRNVAALLVAV